MFCFMMRAPLPILLFSSVVFSTTTRAQVMEVDTTWWMTDGNVRAIAEDTAHQRVVIGGDFQRLIPPYNTAHGGVVYLASGIMRQNDVRPDDRVRCVLPDGAGGWYIGGDFMQVDGVFRQHVAHVQADGSLAPWNPVVNGVVNAMAIKGDTMYIGGSFTVVNGQPKSNLAAVRLSTGANVLWAPFANDQVRTLVIDAGELFIGGDFTTVGGQARNRIAVYSIATHALLPWSADMDGPVHVIRFAPYGVLVGGDFVTVNGVARSRLASFNRTTAALNAWNPGPNGIVRCMQVDGANIYIGGDFTMINASPREHLALVHSGGGLSSLWVNDTDDSVYSMRLVGSGTLLIGGQFNMVSGIPRPRAAALVTQGGTQPWLLPWAPAGDGTVRCMEVVGTNVYLGGGFDTLGVARRHVAMLDASSGQPLAWNEGVNGSVHALLITDQRTFIGGDFDSTGVASTLRSNLAAFENSTGALSAWNPGTNGWVRCLAHYDGQVYAGGSFSYAGGVGRNGFAQIDAGSGANGALDIGVGPDVMHTINDTLYLGGLIFGVNGVNRRSLASIKLPSGSLTAFNPWVVHDDIFPIELDHITSTGGRLYFSGEFTTVDGQPRRNYGCTNTTAGADLGWDPGFHTPSGPLAISGGLVFVAAAEELGTGIALRAVDRMAGDMTGASLVMDTTGTCMIATASGDLFMGGSFTSVDGRAVAHLVRVKLTPTLRVRAFLQGPFDPGTQLMNNNLGQLAAIPLTEPYTGLGYVHAGGGGGEVAPASINPASGTNAIVDWVLIELRSASDPSVVVASQSALLQRDGDVVSHDLGPLLPFGPDPAGLFHIAIRHRNHLGAMTAAPMDIGGNALADFAASGADTYGTDAVLSDPYFSLLRAGDTNFDGELKYVGAGNDRDPILLRVGGTTPNGTVIGYFNEDVTLNGISQYVGSFNDRDLILQNVGGLVPTATRTQQLP